VQKCYPLVAICLMMTGCGPAVDVPDNVPMLGKWRDETRVMSVQINGAAVDRSKLSGIQKDKVSETCMEPKLRNDAEMRELIGRNQFMENCELKPIARNGAYASFSGICSKLPIPHMADMEGVGGLRGQAWESANKATLSMVVEAAVREKTGNGTMFRMDVNRTLTRLGDC
jgi:hypothetical protein